jgi:hypothetical protein
MSADLVDLTTDEVLSDDYWAWDEAESAEHVRAILLELREFPCPAYMENAFAFAASLFEDGGPFVGGDTWSAVVPPFHELFSVLRGYADCIEGHGTTGVLLPSERYHLFYEAVRAALVFATRFSELLGVQVESSKWIRILDASVSYDE